MRVHQGSRPRGEIPVASTNKPPTPNPLTPPTWMNSATRARLWLSYWPLMEPAVHTLKLATVKIHEYGLQFESDHALPLRLLLPPMTAIAVKGLVIHEDSPLPHGALHQISVRFTTIRESDRRRLVDYTNARRVVRLGNGTIATTSKPSTQTF